MGKTARIKSAVLGALGLPEGFPRGKRGPFRIACRLGRPSGPGAPVMVYFRALNLSKTTFVFSEACIELECGRRLPPSGRHGAYDLPLIEPGHTVSSCYPMRPLAEDLLEMGYEETARVDFVVCDHEGKGYRTAVLIRGLERWAAAGEGPAPVPLQPIAKKSYGAA